MQDTQYREELLEGAHRGELKMPGLSQARVALMDDFGNTQSFLQDLEGLYLKYWFLSDLKIIIQININLG